MTPFEKIEKEKIYAVIRTQKKEDALREIKAVTEGGINIIEIILENADIAEALKETTSFSDRPLVLAGGIITERQAQIAIDFGADVIVSPIFQMNLVKLCKSERVPLIMTATTPNEAYSAWKARTQLIKISPASPMGGAEYIEDILRTMKFLNLIAAGSIEIEDVPAYIRAGVKAVGLGRALFKDASYDEIVARTQSACDKIKLV